MIKDFPSGQYGVIYADPPWPYKMYSEKGHAKGAEAQYNTMTFADMAAMRDDILFAAQPNSVLVMWTTWAADPANGIDHLQWALDLMKIWGFTRKSGGDWSKITNAGKQVMGPGYIFRSASECFIIGTIGSPRIKNHSTRNSLITGDIPADLTELIGLHLYGIRREHSRKPDEMADALVKLFDGPYLELFGRTQRPGWTVWGNETDKFKNE